MKKAAKKNIEWADDKSPIPDPGPERERVIAALEGLLREYRAGTGDVLCRMTAWADEAGEPRSFVDAITVLFLGEDSLPETRFNGGSVMVRSKREYAALASIGGGSAERGVAQVVHAALAWAKRDREGMVEWFRTAGPRLEPHGFIGGEAQKGLLRARLWNIPCGHPTWWGDLEACLEPAGLTAQHFNAEDVIRAMALAWERRDFPGRVLAPRRAA